MMGYGYGMMGGFGMFIPLLLIALIVYAVVKFTIGGNKNCDTVNRRNDDALDILKQRYARGEISEEEYMQKMKILRD